MFGAINTPSTEPKHYCIWFNKKPCWSEFSSVIKDPEQDLVVKMLACVVCQLKDMNRAMYQASKKY